ncbi:MAG TPA: hypothetical protein VGL35_06130 [Rhizomicrobium sp.]
MASKRLKVFQARLGFFDSIVAAPSQKAALAAWGAGGNEFAKGFAGVATDPAVVEQALGHPGKVLKRPVGSKGAYKLDADRIPVPKVAARPRRGAGQAAKLRKKREAEKRRAAEREMENARQEELRKMMDLRKREAALEKEKLMVREKTEQRIARAKARLAGSRR